MKAMCEYLLASADGSGRACGGPPTYEVCYGGKGPDGLYSSHSRFACGEHVGEMKTWDGGGDVFPYGEE